MILLSSTSQKLQLTYTATGAIDVHADYVDYASSGTTVTPGNNSVAITAAATTTDIVTSPAASTSRNVKNVSVRNSHASVTQTVTVKWTDGSVTVELFKCSLAAGEALTFVDGDGWAVFDASGNRKTTATNIRGFLQRTVLTSGTTFTTTNQTNLIKLYLVGGGGAGGGCTVGSASISGGAGGGSAGGYAEKTFTVSPNTGYTYAIGAAGAAGATGANAGGNGGNTTFTVGATTVTANGGNGGLGCTSAAAVVTLGGAAPSVSTNGDVNASGQPGGFGFVSAVGVAVSGAGGTSEYGAGGNALKTQGTGNAGIGRGSGGGGGCTISTTGAVAGGAGTAGMIIVEEYA